jgi:type IV secretory pathway ATPase VirB11/archaellum biosynthesis ATPase
VERRDKLIEHLASLDPVPGALDQIVQHFGSDKVAEVTGRSRRIVAKLDGTGDRRLAVESRARSANIAETQAFQDDEKRILVFSDAGGTGRSYHADLGAKIYRLADYVSARIMSGAQAKVLTLAVAERKNILVVGGTSSGKTTLVNALLAEVAGLDERVVILEDTRELKCAASDCVALRTKPGVATLADLVRSTLRLRPDRIVVGEVRGPEALDMLKAWNTGHPGGITTVHANSAAAGLSRLEQLVQEAVVTVPRSLIVEAIDIVVFLSGRGPSRRVETLLELTGVDDNSAYVLRPLDRPALHPV